MKRLYESYPVEWLLRMKKQLEFKASNWQRRIGEIESRMIGASGYQSVAEYRRRIRRCRREIEVIDEELELREEASK